MVFMPPSATFTFAGSPLTAFCRGRAQYQPASNSDRPSSFSFVTVAYWKGYQAVGKNKNSSEQDQWDKGHRPPALPLLPDLTQPRQGQGKGYTKAAVQGARLQKEPRKKCTEASGFEPWCSDPLNQYLEESHTSPRGLLVCNLF